MMEYIVVLMWFVLFGEIIAEWIKAREQDKRLDKIESQLRYQEELLNQINKAIPTPDSIERLVGNLIVRAERSTIVEKR